MLREWGCTLARGLECVEGNTASGIVLEDLTVVRSHNDGCATLFGEAVQELGDSQTVLSIEVPCRLVGEDELGTADEGAGDGDTLLLTASPRNVVQPSSWPRTTVRSSSTTPLAVSPSIRSKSRASVQPHSLDTYPLRHEAVESNEVRRHLRCLCPAHSPRS